MALDKLLDLLKPFSEKYGSSNPQVDMLILFAAASIVFLLLALKIITKAKINSQMARGRNSYGDHIPYSESAAELKLHLDDLTRDLMVISDSLRGDIGFVRQETFLIKQTIEDTKRILNKKSFRKGGIFSVNENKPLFNVSDAA